MCVREVLQQDVTLATTGELSVFLLHSTSAVAEMIVNISLSLLEEGVEHRDEGEGEERG